MCSIFSYQEHVGANSGVGVGWFMDQPPLQLATRPSPQPVSGWSLFEDCRSPKWPWKSRYVNYVCKYSPGLDPATPFPRPSDERDAYIYSKPRGRPAGSLTGNWQPIRWAVDSLLGLPEECFFLKQQNS